jgi:hypothetical protein
MFPSIGVPELLITCVVGLLSIGLPVAILVLLFMIYNKLKSIEASLKNNDLPKQ